MTNAWRWRPAGVFLISVSRKIACGTPAAQNQAHNIPCVVFGAENLNLK
jgi:hypothetical protein